MLEVTTDWYLTLAAILFSIGFLGMMIRKNALIMFMCIELMLNAVNLTFIAASKHFGQINGQVFVFFVLVVAAAEVVVGLAIIVSIFINFTYQALYYTTVNVQYIQIRTFALRYNLVGITMTFDTI